MPDTNVLDRVRHALSGILDRPGAVLFSGADTLVSGAFYVMGFNPGGNPDWPDEGSDLISGDCSSDVQTIHASFERGMSNYNDWTDGRYGSGGTLSPLQKRIRSVFEALGTDPRRTFSTNALFTRSSAASRTEGPWQLWWEHCWPVHRMFIAVVRPRVIVCLGDGPDPSTWELLRLTKPKPQRQKAYDANWPADQAETAIGGKWRPEVVFDLGEDQKHSCAVLGLPHPSARVTQGWPLTPEALRKIGLAREAAA